MNPPDEGARPARRKRYRGTHPRSFEDRYKELDPARYPELTEQLRAKGATPAGSHVPIMVAEVLRELAPCPGDVVIDCTLGFGGHATEFLVATDPGGRVVGLDCDGREIDRTRERLARFGDRLLTRRSSYAGIAKALASVGVDAADVVFADLGVSSMQLDDPKRGFSFKREGPLDLRMDQRRKKTAADLLAELEESELERALREYADEPCAAEIAHAVVATRAAAPLRTTLELARVVCRAQGLPERVPDDGPRAHPAARTFQALRILVNDEFAQLEALLRALPYCLRPGGRAGFLVFHSGEERLVRAAFERDAAAGFYALPPGEPLRPSALELRANRRAASARFLFTRRG